MRPVGEPKCRCRHEHLGTGMNSNKPMREQRSLTRSIESPQEGQCRPSQLVIKFFTVPQVADSLSVSTRTVRRWIDKGELIAHRIGGVRIAEGDLRAFIAARRQA